jgi:PAS domain S-box-containing protein
MLDVALPVLDSLDIGVIVLNSDRRVVCWNYWIATASGIPSAQAEGKTLSELFPNAKLTRLMAAVGAALETGISSIITHSLHPGLLPLRTRSGKKLVHNVMIGVLGKAMPFTNCSIQIFDITGPYERETVLRQRQNARYDAVVNSASDAILTLDPTGLIRFANPATSRHLGYQTAELIGQPASTLFKSQSGWESIWDATVNGEERSDPMEVAAIRKDGAVTYVEVSASRWHTNNGSFVSIILRDVNERRQIAKLLKDMNATLEHRVAERTEQLQSAEEALRQSQKMEAIGQLTGGIAHDFNNLLQGIIGSLDRIQKYVFEGRLGDVGKFIGGAQTSAKRASALVHRLLAFSRRQPIDPKPLDVGELTLSIEELVRRSLGEKISIGISAAPDLWLVRCDPNQLENAILNLAINARDAMPHGGSIRIAARNLVLNEREAVSRDIAPGEYVHLSVADTGTGMSADVKARAFDPFYTTKPIGQGTGLGLSMIYGFVRQSDGTIWIDSTVGQGTSINILLPRFTGQLIPEVQETQETFAVSHIKSNKVVLVVEDETIVRILVNDIVEDLGYLCLEAGDGVSALRILDSGQRVDLLVTDIGLPGLNGRQLADAARVKRPALKVLFMTGYAETASGKDFLGEDMEIIAKPFEMDVLTNRIRTMLQSRNV